MSEQQSDNVLNRLEEQIKNKMYEQAIGQLQRMEFKESSIQLLLKKYSNSQISSEDQCESWICLFGLSASEKKFSKEVSKVIVELIEKIVNLSSPKYAILIIKSVLHKIAANNFGIFIITSSISLFYSLICDPTISDLIELFQQFSKIHQQLKREIIVEKQNPLFDVTEYFYECITSFLNNVQFLPIKLNKKYQLQGIELLGRILSSLQSLQEYKKEAIDIKLPLRLLSKLQVTNYFKLPIIFAKSYFDQICISNQAASQILGSDYIFLYMVNTLNFNLKPNLNSPLSFSPQTQTFIYQLISIVADKFQKDQDKFVVWTNYEIVIELIQKIQIFMGSINPSNFLYKKIFKIFVQLPFLKPEMKQRFYSVMIKKHSNQSFKTHLVTQYRHILAQSTSKTVWIRSSNLLFQQLKNIDPRSGSDYVGHILSLAFFWKGVLNKHQKNKQFQRQCHLHVVKLKEEFEVLLKKLKSGLQLKLKMNDNDISELQRNQTSLCLFRINELTDSHN